MNSFRDVAGLLTVEEAKRLNNLIEWYYANSKEVK